MAKRYFALFDALFILIAAAFYNFGRSLDGYKTEPVQLGLFLVIVTAGLVILGTQMVRLVRGSTQDINFGAISVHFLTYGIMIALVIYVGIAGLTVENWYANRFLAAFVIAVATAVAIFAEDVRSIDWNLGRKKTS